MTLREIVTLFKEERGRARQRFARKVKRILAPHLPGLEVILREGKDRILVRYREKGWEYSYHPWIVTEYDVPDCDFDILEFELHCSEERFRKIVGLLQMLCGGTKK